MRVPAILKRGAAKHVPHPHQPGHEHRTCLNCGAGLSGNYCSQCGQSAHTHRLSILHFVVHDLVHSIWHIDRGIFYTLKEVVVRPGYAALYYIRGKRAGKFPILTLLLLLLGSIFWLSSLQKGVEHSTFIRQTSGDEAIFKRINDFLQHNLKWVLLSLLPVGSLSTLIVFRRARLNYTEHLVVNSYVFGGLLTGVLAVKLITLAFPVIGVAILRYRGLLTMLFYIMGYWQAYHTPYRIRGMIWRYMALFLLNILLLALALGVIFIAATVLSPEFAKAIQK